MEIKDIIKQRRLELNLTLDDVARMVGVSGATISRWESGDIANMKRDKIVGLSKALQISPSIIMGWEEEPPEAPTYYSDPEVAVLAQEIHDNPDLRILMDAARDVEPNAVKQVAAMLEAFKNTNRD